MTHVNCPAGLKVGVVKQMFPPTQLPETRGDLKLVDGTESKVL